VIAPVLIVGQGLAGTALAWCLWERGVPFVIADPNEAETSSRIAAGLVTPITGRRLNLSWRVYELLPEARAFYERVQKELGAAFYHELATVRLLNDEREVNWWRERGSRGELLPFLEAGNVDSLNGADSFHSELGGFVQKHSGWLDAPGYLRASRAFFQKANRVRETTVEESELELGDESVKWRGENYAAVISCRGWKEQRKEGHFSWLNFDSSRGVIATIHADLPEQRIVNRGCWLLPKGGSELRAGSTYEFDFSRTLEESVADLQGKLAGLLRAPFEILDAQRGVRPIVKQRQLILGRHPAHDRLCVFNGLGSKGVLRAPFFARMLVAHLLDGAPLEPEVDVRSND
jgi:glycine/D-amino acid oxidase-like deaminating enzyme